ncbi:MAG: hypothetical protein D5R97_06785 [Candidatus Syntrophonatronum acetioxidans]|uniref:Uncharacterized protein n=1 Tax=Candidatus Syntrophonatronum acetioxidans TaxID=1795816 RepID=A0A424YDG0_9FIRM|nr:MAG: hypothetical protein D5R97_06785 [Candidatus Syntrophonatronum acetioxidans]
MNNDWDIGSIQSQIVYYTLREIENIVQSSMNLYYFKLRQKEVSPDGDTIYFEVNYGKPEGGLETLTAGVPLTLLLKREIPALSRIFIDLLSDKI